MKSHHPFMRAFLLSMLIGLLMASAAMAKGGGLASISLSPTRSVAQDQPACGSQESDQPDSSDSQESDQPDSSDSQESDQDCNSPEPSPTSSSGNTADREKACKEAAGVTDLPEVSNAPTQGKTTGVDNAIQRVMANCIKNPQAPGLLNALRHLVANRARHEAHDADKAARRAEHDAAKAERHGPETHNGHGHGSGD